jgi:UDP:flavonoid glycosyltransferase YjiC (YdhE family)
MNHIHVAEALGVPLHIMFPQPWYYGTKAYPHPCSGLPILDGKSENFSSYGKFDLVSNASFFSALNRWRRKTLELPEVQLYEIATAITKSQIPFSAMWSPSLNPKPSDWPEQCRVVGTFVIDQKSSAAFDESEFSELSEWLAAGPPPVFLGFGSMVIDDTARLAEIIKNAVVKADCRMVVQSSWSSIDVSDEPRCMNVGPCPHDWLLPQMCAVIHHGGAGTTAAGLRFGLPTFICPFFGDQYLWGEMVFRAGVGPIPCPIDDLTEDLLTEKLSELQRPEIRSKAKWMAEQMDKEDGIQGGLDHFLSSLPRDNMFCDVSILLGENQQAKLQLEGTKLKVSMEVASLLTLQSQIDTLAHPRYLLTGGGPLAELRALRKHMSKAKRYGSHQMKTHAVMTYALGRVEDLRLGCKQGLVGFIYNIVRSPFQLFFKPDHFARSHGAFGCLWGLLVSPLFIIKYILLALVILVDRLLVGVSNGCFDKNHLTLINRGSYYQVNSVADKNVELQLLAARGMSKSRKKELFRGLDMAVAARKMFDDADPTFPEDHWHYTVAKAKDLRALVAKNTDSYLKLSDSERAVLLQLLEEKGDESLSFSMFCVLIREATKDRESEYVSLRARRSRRPSLAELFLTEEEVAHLAKAGLDLVGL